MKYVPHRRISDDGYKVYDALAVLTWHPKVVKFLDETDEGKDLLEALYELRDNPELMNRFRID